ncbi:thermonuclease family protein [Paracoccus stylophorae]|uniref:Thermonuclease family protein n=1 Tax=Paracoccus stylophorae TaxID=659350 RepID=A0ABY7T022_9RHOB|nr:thermonuclease family protein [Paracoccus stylophorae]WCR11497.1 thermonuclease family protein [Paracoccus stylophorae]
MTPSRFDFAGQVTRVVDGDTFWISGERTRIRVWGLDAPEIGRTGGSAATAQLAGLVSGRSVQCRMRDVDRYGRIVGQCWLPDGRDIAAAMIASGTAREYCRFSGNYYGTC